MYGSESSSRVGSHPADENLYIQALFMYSLFKILFTNKVILALFMSLKNNIVAKQNII